MSIESMHELISTLVQAEIRTGPEKKPERGDRYWLFDYETPKGNELQLLRIHLVLVAPPPNIPIPLGGKKLELPPPPRILKTVSLSFHIFAEKNKNQVGLTILTHSKNGMYTNTIRYDHMTNQKSEVVWAFTMRSSDADFFAKELISEEDLPAKINFWAAVHHILDQAKAGYTENIDYSMFNLETDATVPVNKYGRFHSRQ